MADRQSIPVHQLGSPVARLEFRLIIGSLFACSCLCSLAQAGQADDLQTLSELQWFAIDGMETGRAVINQDPQVALDEFGLPDQIKVHHERAVWDIDTEATPAEWMYAGFSINVPFLRSADTSTGEWVPLNYRPGQFIGELTAFDSAVPVRLGLNVGVPASRVLQTLGLPSNAKSNGRIYTIVDTEHLIGRNVEIVFHLDEKDFVTKIVWSLAAWH